MDTSCARNPYPFFNQLPCSLKVLYTMVLLTMGLGYLFAMIQIYEVHSGRDGQGGISVKDIQIAYSGNKAGTRLEGALNGPMSGMLPADEKAKIIGWIHSKAEKNKYEDYHSYGWARKTHASAYAYYPKTFDSDCRQTDGATHC